MSNDSYVFTIKNSENMSDQNHIRIQKNMEISFTQTRPEFSLFKVTVEVNDQVRYDFFSVLNLTPEELQLMNLEADSVLSLRFLLENYSIGIEMSGLYPVNIIFYPINSKVKVLFFRALTWISLEMQILKLLDTEHKVDGCIEKLKLSPTQASFEAVISQVSIMESLKARINEQENLINRLTERVDKIDPNSSNFIADLITRGINPHIYNIDQSLSSIQEEINNNNKFSKLKLEEISETSLSHQELIERLRGDIDLFNNSRAQLPTFNQIEIIEDKVKNLDNIISQIHSENDKYKKLTQEEVDKLTNSLSSALDDIKKLNVLHNTFNKLSSEMEKQKIKLSEELQQSSLELRSKIEKIEANEYNIEETLSSINDQLKLSTLPIFRSVNTKLSLKDLKEFYSSNEDFQCDYSKKSFYDHDQAISFCTKVKEDLYAVGYGDGSFHLRNIESHKIVEVYPKEHTSHIRAIIVINKNIITGSSDKLIKVWSNKNVKSLMTLNHDDCVNTLVIIRNTIFASGGNDKLIKLWDINANNQFLKQFNHHIGSVCGLTMMSHVGNDQIMLSVSSDKSLRLWIIKNDISQSDHHHCIMTEKSINSCLQLTSSAVILGTNSTIDIWNVFTSQLIKSLAGHSDQVNQIIRLSSYVVASSSKDNTIRIWDLSKMAEAEALIDHSNQVNGLIKLNKGKLLSISNDKSIRIWGN